MKGEAAVDLEPAATEFEQAEKQGEAVEPETKEGGQVNEAASVHSTSSKKRTLEQMQAENPDDEMQHAEGGDVNTSGGATKTLKRLKL